MNGATKAFLRSQFQEYYTRRLEMPPRFREREWGFIPFGEQMYRHKAFGEDIHEYLRRNGPAHSYYSVAYYGNPSARTMDGKEWLGADLIFDLDADHIHGEYTYKEMLDRVKEETCKLIDDFLIADFGFSEKELEIVFSGGRGYHVHISREDVLKMGSNERREIVDYIKGNGLGKIVEKVSVPVEVKRGMGSTGSWRMVNTGWGRRISKRLAWNLKKLGELEQKEALKKLKDIGFKKTMSHRILEACRPEAIGFAERGMLINDGVKDLAVKLVETEREWISENLSPAIDSPVSADTHRLIRLPGSLHGGSSLLTKTLTRKEMDSFEPLRDAVYFGDEPCRIVLNQPSEVELKEKKYKMSAGAGSVPLCVAMHLMCRGVAEHAP